MALPFRPKRGGRRFSLREGRRGTARLLTIIIGTRAQVIKMAPVLRELKRRDYPCRVICTGQHQATMRDLFAEFGITVTVEYIYSGREVSGLGSMALWLPLITFRMLRWRRQLFSDGFGGRALVLVHGDTFSTLVGALAGRLAGCPVGHVESGLRSFSLLNPFPEEITRLLVFRLSDIAFCPGAWASGNMAKYRVEVVNTGHNTLLDALRLAVNSSAETTRGVPGGYCVVSVHRFENIFCRRRLEWIVQAVERVSAMVDVVFILHPATAKRLEKEGHMSRLTSKSGIRMQERVSYMPFVRLLREAAFVVTDGGGNQEELHYLGKATLLLRNETERREGLDDRAVLCRFDDHVLSGFLKWVREEGDGTGMLGEDILPSARIVETLQASASGNHE